MKKQSHNLNSVISLDNMRDAWVSLATKNSAPGIDSISPDLFARNAENRLDTLHNEIIQHHYLPQPLITFPKEKKDHTFRELTIPTLRDKIVAKTIAQNQVQRFNSRLEPQCWAYRPHKGATQAVAVVERTIANQKTKYVVRIDIKAFFDSINHDIMRQTLTQFGNDPQLIELIMLFVANRRFDGVKISAANIGIPQGTPLAPVMSNLYLDMFDKQLNQCQIPFIRFADDIIIFAQDIEQAGNYLNQATILLRELKLTTATAKTRIYTVADGFPFLGFFFSHSGKVPCHEAQQRLSEKINSPRYDDETEVEYDKRIKSIIRGWKNYYYFDQKEQSNSKDKPIVIIDHEQPKPQPAIVDTEQNANRAAEQRFEQGINILQTLETEDGLQTIEPPATIPNNSQAQTITTPIIEELPSSTPLNSATETVTTELQATITHIDELIATEHEHAAIHQITQLLNDDLELPEKIMKSLYAKIANLYETQGLLGAADRCRKIAGIKTPPNRYKNKAELTYGTEQVEQWLDVFAADGPVYRQYIDRVGRAGYKPASKSIHPAYLRDHWLGKHTLAVPIFDKNNNTRFAVIDFDISRKQLNTMKKAEIDELKIALLDNARAILDIAQQAGVKAVLEDSGYKGYHLWFFFFDRLDGALVKNFIFAINKVAPPAPAGTHRELFPASQTITADKLNSRIKLPLGMHRLSGKYSQFLKPDGTPSKQGILKLSSHACFNRARDLKNAISQWRQFTPPENSQNNSTSINSDIDKLFNSCDVLKALKFKAEQSHILTHHERVVLRGILAPLGDAGRATVHQIMQSCNNYSRTLTDKMFGDGHSKPMGCSRIKEILSYMTPQLNCNCNFRKTKNGYPNPLRHLTIQNRSPKHAPQQPPNKSTVTKTQAPPPKPVDSNPQQQTIVTTPISITTPNQQSPIENSSTNNPEPLIPASSPTVNDTSAVAALHIKIGKWSFNMNLFKN